LIFTAGIIVTFSTTDLCTPEQALLRKKKPEKEEK
jgi:hypothetical protein